MVDLREWAVSIRFKDREVWRGAVEAETLEQATTIWYNCYFTIPCPPYEVFLVPIVKNVTMNA